MSVCLVRRATPEDIRWLVHFNCQLAKETENKELDRSVVTRGVQRAFDQGDEAIYFVAQKGPEPIGSLMLTREWSDWRDGWLAWIQSVYVLPDYRGQGVFRTLLQHATDSIALSPDVIGLRLYVESENHRAQRVYMRSGFTDPSYKVLEKMIERNKQ